jgi:hypothetical protein
VVPHVSRLLQDDTHRLIPSAYDKETVLNRLTTDSDELTALFELEGATNERLVGEAGLLPGIHGSGTRVWALLLPHCECSVHSCLHCFVLLEVSFIQLKLNRVRTKQCYSISEFRLRVNPATTSVRLPISRVASGNLSAKSLNGLYGLRCSPGTHIAM